MVKKDIKYTRLIDYEDNENPLISILIKERNGRKLCISGLYRQWKAPGEADANISCQCRRLEKVCENLQRISTLKCDHILGGDLNIDRH